MRLKSGARFEPEKFRVAIKKDGEEVRGFDLQVRAKVEQRDGRYFLRPGGVAQQFAVRDGPSAHGLDPFVGRQVRVRGRLASDGPPLELELTEVASP